MYCKNTRKSRFLRADQVGIEPTTHELTVRCYYQLSYWSINLVGQGRLERPRSEDNGFTVRDATNYVLLPQKL